MGNSDYEQNCNAVLLRNADKVLTYLTKHPGADGPTIMAHAHLESAGRSKLLRTMEDAQLIVYRDGPNGFRDGGWFVTLIGSGLFS